MWAITFASAIETPIWGKGLGSSRVLLTRLHGNSSHVHNEYLRFWHDHGIPGVMLLLFGLGSFGVWSIRGLRTSTDKGVLAHHLTALFALMVLGAQMMTANPLQYAFFVIPFGLLSGISFRLAVSGQRYDAASVKPGINQGEGEPPWASLHAPP